MGELLKVENLNVYYGSIHAIKDLSLHVNEGEIVTMIGANGAGKTTTMHAISGLLKSRSGSITYDGHLISRMDAYRIVTLGLAQCPEGRRVFSGLTVHENLELGAYSRKDGKAAIQDDFNMVFDISDLPLSEVPYVSLLERFIGLLDTEKYTYTDFTNEMYLHTGGISTNTAVHEVFGDHDKYKMTFEVRSKFIYEEAEQAKDLAMEMICHTKFSDTKRLKELNEKGVNKSGAALLAKNIQDNAEKVRALNDKIKELNEKKSKLA
jgi:ABC-type methionine transport system ATPase subunit